VSAGAAPDIQGVVRLEGADADRIGRAVKDLWKAAADGPGGGSVQRACLLNLVAVLADGGQSGDTFRALDALAASHPARTVVVIPDASMPAGAVRSEVSIFCSFTPGSGRHVCAERIVLRAAADAAGRLHQTVLALCVDELPRMVWWRDPAGGARGILGRLAPHVDGLVVDSRDWPRDAASLAAVAAMRGGGMPVRDLNWGRVTPWRELTAQAFDPPAARGALASLDSVQVSVSPDAAGGVPASARLYLGWLADRLGWRLVPEGGVARADGGPVALQIGAAQRSPGGHDIASVVLRSAREGAEFSFTRATNPDMVAACSDAPGLAGSCRWVDFGPCPTAALLARELNHTGRDAAYERALDYAARLARMPRA
jgi:glucose-6-phosphate dehydrogenase assembly protein OpcA